jgi:hypothetical protein
MRGKFSTWVVIGLVVGGLSLMFPNNKAPEPSPTESSVTDPFADPTDSPSADPTDPGTDATGGSTSGAAYWTKGFTAVDVTDSVSNNCTEYDMCVFVKMKTVNTCSTITLSGSIYDAEDTFIDTFDVDYATLKGGKSRLVEFGTDALDDNEEYVELDDATCYK